MTHTVFEALNPLKPHPYQEADVRELIAHNCTGFVTAETGAGKTVIAVEAAVRSDAKVIVIVAIPSTFEDVWERTIVRQDPTADVRIISGTDKGRRAFEDLQLDVPGYYLVSHQVFRTWKGDRDFLTTRPELAIVDEAHLLGNKDTPGAQRLMKWKADRRMCLSGTMVRNRFENFWPLLRWVYPDRMMPRDIADISPNRWRATFCDTRYDEFTVGNVKVVGELIPGKLASMIPCYVQHFKRAECCDFHKATDEHGPGFLWDLDEPVHITYDVDLLPEQKKMIKQMEAEYVAWLHTENEGRDGDKKPFIVKLPIVKRIRLRQMALGVPTIRTVEEMVFDKELGIKVPKMVDHLFFQEDCGSAKLDLMMEKIADNEESYVVVTSSKEFAIETHRRLVAAGEKALIWTGDSTEKKRREAKTALREGKIRFIVAVIASIATGIDGLQDACHRIMILDRDQDLTNMTQFFGRLDRRGQREQVIVEEIVARGSFDKKIIGAQLKKEIALLKSLNKRSVDLAA